MTTPEHSSFPFEILYHNAMPDWVKIKGLDIHAIPDWEGGGFAVRQDQARLIITAVNSHAALLAAAKEALAHLDESDDPWVRRPIEKELKAAIACAEEPAP